MHRLLPLALVLGLSLGLGAFAEESPEPAPAAGAPEDAVARGERLLLEKRFLPPSFDQETFDDVWREWPEPLRSEAEAADPETRRRMAYRRYGLTARPGDPLGRPQQYVVGDDGSWTMSCLACHQGKVAGTPVPGVPNTHLALHTLTEEIRSAKMRLKKPLTPTEFALPIFPLGTSNGTTNAVMFSVALLNFRDEHLNLKPPRGLPRFDHHDLDAPPWWHFRKRTRLYIDGFTPKGVRPLIQFTLVPANGPEEVRAFEKDFQDIYAWLMSLEAPPWPHEVNAALARRGEVLFGARCSLCHGTYGEHETYPNRRVPIARVATDPVRLESITPEMRERYANSWFTDYDPSDVVVDPEGYVAPPLDGIWATAPYLHNGSVPTLWHMLHPDDRPRVWRRTEDGYDVERVGLEVECRDAVPEGLSPAERRTWFDTSARGKSADGHRFFFELSEAQKRALLEYLKTL